MKVFKTTDEYGTQYSVIEDGAHFYLYKISPFYGWVLSGRSWNSFHNKYGGEKVSRLEFLVVFGKTSEQVWAQTRGKHNPKEWKEWRSKKGK